MKFVLGLCISIILITASQFEGPLSFKERKSFLPPPPHIEYFSFGFQPVLASFLWLRAIQDFDYCETEVQKHICRGNDWLYQILDASSRLSPDFKEIYSAGGIALSILVSDVQGASEVFRKGVVLFPNDFQLVYRAGYHALYEEKNQEKAANFFLKAARIQGKEGTWLYSLATRLYTDAGKREIGLRLYHEMKEAGLDEGSLQRMREKLGIKDE